MQIFRTTKKSKNYEHSTWLRKMRRNKEIEQELHEYNQWLMEVWNPNQLYIPFAKDAPNAFLKYKKENCLCDNGIIDCPGCKDVEIEKYITKCAGCEGSGKRVCGKCGGKYETK